MWFHKLFEQNTMEENYIFLVQCIYNQVQTDASDYVERDYVHEKPYIEYFLEHINESYKNRLFEIIPYDILKNKVLDAEFGFNNNRDNDYKLYCDINNVLYYELHAQCGWVYEKDYCCEKCTLNECVYI